jgi:shikimate dehydrogenase
MKMLYGLIGEKLNYSYSKEIHESFGLYNYELCELNAQELEKLCLSKNFKGINVTIPYKKTVMPYCDILSEIAKKIGNVNLLMLRDDGKIYGHNTDYDGFVFSLRYNNIPVKDKKILVLGSGATSSTVSAAVEDLGAAEITVVSRGGNVNYNNIYDCKNVEVVVNTTPVGMYPNIGENIIDLSKFPNLCAVCDVIYNPLKTKLLLQAQQLGIRNINGLVMLVAQAKAAAEIFINCKINDCEVERILKKIYIEKSNI